jgi:hypothetical protein
MIYFRMKLLFLTIGGIFSDAIGRGQAFSDIIGRDHANEFLTRSQRENSNLFWLGIEENKS